MLEVESIHSCSELSPPVSKSRPFSSACWSAHSYIESDSFSAASATLKIFRLNSRASVRSTSFSSALFLLRPDEVGLMDSELGLELEPEPEPEGSGAEAATCGLDLGAAGRGKGLVAFRQGRGGVTGTG